MKTCPYTWGFMKKLYPVYVEMSGSVELIYPTYKFAVKFLMIMSFNIALLNVKALLSLIILSLNNSFFAFSIFALAVKLEGGGLGS